MIPGKLYGRGVSVFRPGPEGLARDAGFGIQGVGRQSTVGVRDSAYLPRVGAVVRRGNVDPGAYEVLFEELVGVAAGDPLQLTVRVLPPVDLDDPPWLSRTAHPPRRTCRS